MRSEIWRILVYIALAVALVVLYSWFFRLVGW
jgi:hypothetical protein